MRATRGYFITINTKYTKDENWEIEKEKFEKNILEICVKNFEIKEKGVDYYKYIIFGPTEFGKKEGRMHLHGYVYCNKQKSIMQLKKHWGNEVHFDIAKGTGDHIENYILKGEMSKLESKQFPDKRAKPIFEKGERPLQGNRCDLKEQLKECETVEDFMEEYPETYSRYRNGIKDIYNLKESRKPAFMKEVEVIWIYGPTKTGKTFRAFKEGCKDVEYENGFFKSWGFEKKICLEEMNGKIPFKTLLKITDQYHNYYSVNVKGGYLNVDLEKIVITSSSHPSDLYPRQCEKDGGIDQLIRRITSLIYTGQNELEFEKIEEWKNLRKNLK